MRNSYPTSPMSFLAEPLVAFSTSLDDDDDDDDKEVEAAETFSSKDAGVFEDLTTSTDGSFPSAVTALVVVVDDDDDDDIISTNYLACGSSARYDSRNDS